MGDISDTALAGIVQFCEKQKTSNPNGIGNECTHFVYAALFEANAADGALEISKKTKETPLVQTSRKPYHWGRKLDPNEAKGGDVVQFDDVVQNIYIYSDADNNATWRHDQRIRGPMHTGVLAIGPYHGNFDLYEAHITQDGYNKMQVRTNSVFYESFAIGISKDYLQKNKHPMSLSRYLQEHRSDTAALLSSVNWAALRTPSHEANPLKEGQLKAAFNSGTAPLPDIAIFFQVNVKGSIRLYRPQASLHRQRLTTAERTKEKEKLIKMMKRSGRAGPVGFNWDW